MVDGSGYELAGRKLIQTTGKVRKLRRPKIRGQLSNLRHCGSYKKYTTFS